MISLEYYAHDTEAMIRAIREQGIQPNEAHIVARELEDLSAEVDGLTQELREATTYRANAEAEELSDLRAELMQAKDRIATLEIRLHDERRKTK